jgi:hypothetical protein
MAYSKDENYFYLCILRITKGEERRREEKRKM